MVHVFSHHEHPDPHEHPVIAWIAIIAIVAAMLLIAWARVEIHGVTIRSPRVNWGDDTDRVRATMLAD